MFENVLINNLMGVGKLHVESVSLDLETFDQLLLDRIFRLDCRISSWNDKSWVV